MATLVLAAAGSALGGAVGGSVAGLTSMVLGKAIGATVGSMIDQRVMGLGAEPVETGRVDRFRIMGSSEGAGLPRVFGRMRIAGQIIWSSRFLVLLRGPCRRKGRRWRPDRPRVQLFRKSCHRLVRRGGPEDRKDLGGWPGGRSEGPDAAAAQGRRGSTARSSHLGLGRVAAGSGLSWHGLCRSGEPRPDALRQPDSAIQFRGFPSRIRDAPWFAAIAVRGGSWRSVGSRIRRVFVGDRTRLPREG